MVDDLSPWEEPRVKTLLCRPVTEVGFFTIHEESFIQTIEPGQDCPVKHEKSTCDPVNLQSRIIGKIQHVIGTKGSRLRKQQIKKCCFTKQVPDGRKRISRGLKGSV